jgi:hypothetical protein
MKKLFGIVLVAILAYSSFWYYEASKGKTFIEKKMSEAHIHSDKISVSGFPCYYIVSVENPSWVEENVAANSKGTIHIKTNILGNKFWLTRDGDLHVKLNDFLEVDSFTLKGSSQVYFEVKDAYSLNRVFNALPVEFAEANSSVLFENLKAVNICGKNLQLEMENTEETSVVELGNLNLCWDNTVNETSQTHHFCFNIEDYEIKRKISDKTHQTLEDVLTYTLSKGKSQISFKGDLTIPKGKLNFIELPEMSLNIDDIESSSSIGSGKAATSFSIVKKEENRKEIKFSIVCDSVVSKEGYKARVNDLLNAIKTESIEDFPEAAKLKELVSTNEAAVMKAIPKIDELSPIGLKIDFHVLSKANHPNFDQFDMDIKNLNVTMAPYSLYSDGKFDVEGAVEGAYKLKIEHYKKMLEDSISYGNNLYDVISKIYDEPQHGNDVQITSKMHADILKFLKEISDEPSKDNEDLHVTFKMNKDGSTLIGGLDLSQVYEKYEAIFEKPEEVKPVEKVKEEKAIEKKLDEKKLDQIKQEIKPEDIKEEEKKPELVSEPLLKG